MSENDLITRVPPKPVRVWSETFSVHSYDVDGGKNATLESLCRHFLEGAWNHAEVLGVGFARLAGQGKVWVLSRLLIEVRRSPQWGEVLRLDTWPRVAVSAFAMRDFEMVDGSGQIVVAGVSAWLVLNASTRKPQRIDKLVAGFGTCPDRRALQNDPQKLFPSPDGSELCRRPVQYSDIDVNRHVNSARYIGWVLDSYPLEFHQTHVPALLEVNYVGETHGGESVIVHGREIAPGEYVHSITRSDAGAEVFRARLKWKPILPS